MNRFSRRSILADLAAASTAAATPTKPNAAPQEAPELITLDDEPPHPVLSLPFVRDTTQAEQRAGLPPRIFWSVQPSGNYAEDCNTGARYAHLALDYMTRENSHHVMQWAVFDMMRAGQEHSGIEVGYLSVFGQHACVARRHAESRAAGGLDITAWNAHLADSILRQSTT